MKKSNIFRGFTAVLCVLLALSVIMTGTAMSYAATLNSYLNVKVGEMVHLDGEPVDSTYYKSSYGELTVDNLDRLKADEEAFV